MSECASSCIAQHHSGQNHFQDRYPSAASVWLVTRCDLSLPSHGHGTAVSFDNLSCCIALCKCLQSLWQSAAPHVAHLQTAATVGSQAQASLTIQGAHEVMQDSGLHRGKPCRTSRPVSKRVANCFTNLISRLVGPRASVLCSCAIPFSPAPAQHTAARPAPRKCNRHAAAPH